MKAVFLKAYGGVDQLEYTDAPDPKPGAGQVLIKTAGIGVNPLEWKLREGYLKAVMPLPLPAILGRDISGEVVEVGPGVTRLKKGDKVFGLANATYAELVVAKEDEVTLIPEHMSIADAAALPVVTLTGAQIIEEGVKPKSGDTILITGALGSVGRTAVYVAKIHGALAIAGVRKNQKQEAQLLDVERVVALDDDSDLAGLTELDGIADTVGGAVIEKLIPKLKKGGVVASVLGKPAAAEKAGLRVAEVYMHPDMKRLVALAEDVREGDLTIPIGGRFKLSEIRDAHTAGQKGGGGKIILTP